MHTWLTAPVGISVVEVEEVDEEPRDVSHVEDDEHHYYRLQQLQVSANNIKLIIILAVVEDSDAVV